MSDNSSTCKTSWFVWGQLGFAQKLQTPVKTENNDTWKHSLYNVWGKNDCLPYSWFFSPSLFTTGCMLALLLRLKSNCSQIRDTVFNRSCTNRMSYEQFTTEHGDETQSHSWTWGGKDVFTSTVSSQRDEAEVRLLHLSLAATLLGLVAVAKQHVVSRQVIFSLSGVLERRR